MRFHDKLVADGFLLNHITYGMLIHGLCKTRQTEAVFQLFRQAERNNVSLDVVMYNIIIDGLCKDKLVTDEFDLYNEMILKRISPDVVTYNTLIYGFCIE